jgi:hypothetical protein
LLGWIKLQAAEAPLSEDDCYLRQLRLFYDYMAIHGEKPDAFFVDMNVMHRLARLFGVTPQWDEFECPWGGDICGTPAVQPNEVDAATRGLTTTYRFTWDNLAYVRNGDPNEWYQNNPGVLAHFHLKPHFLKLPKRPTV